MAQNSSGWEKDSNGSTGWEKAADGSAMKVTDTEAGIKTERISHTKDAHDHDIVKVDKHTGRVEEISVGRHHTRSRDK